MKSKWVVAVSLAGLLGAAPAQADAGAGGQSSNESESNPISAEIEKFGQSLCPSLVKPGSDLATTISEMQGNEGLAPTLTGMLTGLAIQLECPAFMTKLANGDLSLDELNQATKGQDLKGLDLAALLKPHDQ